MNFGWLATWVGAPVVIAGVIIVLLTRRRASGPRSSRLDTWTIGLIGSGSFLVFLGGVTALYFGTAVFSSDPTVVRGFGIGNSAVPTFAGKSGAIVDAGYETAWLSISGLPVETRWLMYAETALPALAVVVISVAVFWLSILLLRGRPFVRSLTRLVGVTALVVMVAGIGAQVFASAARASVVEFLDAQVITAGSNMTDSSYEGLSYWTLNLDLAPVGWALSLALVAAAFELGQRLQRDTEGLV